MLKVYGEYLVLKVYREVLGVKGIGKYLVLKA